MLCKQKETKRKMLLPCTLVLTAVLFAFAALCPITAAAAPETDFIELYKGFFKDLGAKKYEKVWDLMTMASKKRLAKLITDMAVAQGKSATETQVFDMLDKNTSNLRTEYFDNLNAEWDKISFLPQVLGGQYMLKSTAKELAILTITVGDEPKDFQIIKEEGRWKLNFFVDLEK